ncbi:hypothetical protein F4780DRAFT_292388 [Xylariomycetidae sp. FL0641]|nr:hypothetical protein F4780DRAFT_292388 [Xylariomycetidae sp. FL0641]
MPDSSLMLLVFTAVPSPLPAFIHAHKLPYTTYHAWHPCQPWYTSTRQAEGLALNSTRHHAPHRPQSISQAPSHHHCRLLAESKELIGRRMPSTSAPYLNMSSRKAESWFPLDLWSG